LASNLVLNVLKLKTKRNALHSLFKARK